ncbi:MAG: FtsX-like permease family protein, partial [Armatimonadota bacterium]|nr:FtsX-like permease family protein [Armatimonadota bacterium]
LLIVPAGTDMTDFWSDGFAEGDMPEEYVYRLSESGLMTIRHLVARLQKRVKWRDRQVLLTGVLPEVAMAHRTAKSPMGMVVERGTALVGHHLARSENVAAGDQIEVLGRRLQVEGVLEEQGSVDDIRIYTHLHDAQQMLGEPGRVNEIEALQCLCHGRQSLANVRQDVRDVLPGVEVTEFRSIAVARSETRRMVERFAGLVIPVIVLAAAVWVGLNAMRNVNERRQEIGILRALGVGSGAIAALFLLKVVAVGLAGAALGWAAGTWLAVEHGANIFPLTAKKIAPIYPLLGWSLLGAAALCLVASYLPALSAVLQDPAEVLTEE